MRRLWWLSGATAACCARGMTPTKILRASRPCSPDFFNVLVRTTNVQVIAFYEKLGYARDDAFSLGKRLIPDL